MMRRIPIILLALLPTCTLQAAQIGTVEMTDGNQLTGPVTFSKESITIVETSGKSHTIPYPQMRIATLSRDPSDGSAQAEKARNGLRGRYYSNIKHEDTPVERIDANISFNWGEAKPIDKVRPNGFSVRWEGEVEPPVGGEITFEVESDDGCRLWVDGELLIEHWQAQSPTIHSEKIKLEANRRYPIKVEYYDAWGDAIARLRWRAEGLPRDIIPSKHLFPLALNNPIPPKFHHEVCLRSGSTLAGKITSADSSRVRLTTADGPVIIPTPAVGYMKFAHSWGTDLGVVLKLKPPGVAFLNRDYAEGMFKDFSEGVARVESVLFGKQKIQQAELRAIKLAEPVAKPAKFWVFTTADHRLYLNSIETLPDGQLRIRDASGYHLTVPAARIRQVRVGSPFDPK